MSDPHADPDNIVDEDEDLLDAAEAAEVVPDDPDEDHPMDSDNEESVDLRRDGVVEEELQLQNDSTAHFDQHADSIFCIAQHPLRPSLIATGGGDDTVYIFSSDYPTSLQPSAYESNPSPHQRDSQRPIARLSGHTDSVNAIAFTLPSGDFLVTGGLDGQLRVHDCAESSYPLIASAREFEDINFLISCLDTALHPNTFALGSSDGSVWVYSIQGGDAAGPLQVLQVYNLHTESCTAGAWTPDGTMLVTVSEDGSLYIWDPFGDAAAAGIKGAQGGQAIVSLTASDQRFIIEGGLYSVAVAPNGAFAAVGGADGMIRIVGLPRIEASHSATQGLSSRESTYKSSSSRDTARPLGSTSTGQAGQILASLQTQADSIETLSFSPAPLTIMAAGSVDGSVELFDTAHRFAVRRNIKEAHDGYAVVKVEFGRDATVGHLLTTCGLDGLVRRWDVRGGTTAAGQGLLREWKGHRGQGEGGGVLGFVQDGGRVVTAGDDGLSLIFDTAT